MSARHPTATVRAILVADFPDRFVQDRILPELRKRVDVVLVAKTRAAAGLDLASYAPDVVLHMTEFGSHSTSEMLSATCRRAGITVRALSRKKASWSFLPPPRAEVKLLDGPPREPLADARLARANLAVAASDQVLSITRVSEEKNMEQKTNGTPSRATIGDLPGARTLLSPDAKSATPAPPARTETVIHELGEESSKMLAALASVAPAIGEKLAAALVVHASSLRHHGDAMYTLARAVAALASASPSPAVTAKVKAPPPPNTTAMLEAKIVEIVTKFPKLAASEIYVLVAGGAGGAGVKTTVNAVQVSLRKLVTEMKLDRSNAGTRDDPYRYFVAALDPNA